MRLRVGKPKLVDGLVYVPWGGGVIVDGLRDNKVLGGVVGKSLLPRLLPLLDGTKSIDELQQELTIPKSDIRAAIRFLEEQGLCEREDVRVQTPEGLEATYSFVNRVLVNHRADSAMERGAAHLTQTQACVIASSAVRKEANTLAQLLEGSGIRCSVPDIWPPQNGHSEWNNLLIIYFSMDGDDVALLEELDKSVRAREGCWIRIVASAAHQTFQIGPIFRAPHAYCYSCFASGHAVEPARPGSNPEAVRERWTYISVASAMIVAHIVGGLEAFHEYGFIQYEMLTGQAKELIHGARPECIVCRPGSHKRGYSPPFTPATLLYEDQVMVRSRNDLKLTRGSLAQTRVWQPIGPSKSTEIEEHRLDVNAGAVSYFNEGLSGASLNALLQWTVGDQNARSKGTQTHKWIPSSGDLGSVSVKVAIRKVEPLASGIYDYVASARALISISRKESELQIADFIRNAVPNDCAEQPNALLMLIGDFDRLAAKYGAFAYTLLHLDTGVAIAQALFVAECFAISATSLSWWAEDILFAESITTSATRYVTGMIALWDRPAPHSSFPEPFLRDRSQTRSGLEKMSTIEIVNSLRADCVTVRADWETSRSTGGPTELPQNQSESTGSDSVLVSLPPPDALSAHQIRDLTVRSTARIYTEEAVTMQQLGTLLSYATQHVLAPTALLQSADKSIEVIVNANRVHGVEQGVYAYDVARHAVRKVRERLSVDECTALFIQSEFAVAPLQIFVTTDMSMFEQSIASKAHAYTLVRVGTVVRRCGLAASGIGLSTAIVGGVIRGMARFILGADGYRRHIVAAVSVGQSTTETVASGE